jgi:ribose transport system substrate-binding protein
MTQSVKDTIMIDEAAACRDASAESAVGPGGGIPALNLGRRRLLSVGAAACVAVAVGAPRAARASGAKFCAALGWTSGESGRHIVNGYKDAVASFGGTIEMSDANYDPKKQSEQILAFIATKPTILFVTPSDPVAIAPAVQSAIAAGIPVFCADSIVPGAAVTSTAMSNNYGMGAYNAQYIVDRLNKKGRVAMITLPENLNEGWISRAMGARSIFARYPDIQIVHDKPYEVSKQTSSGAGSLRDTVSGILDAHADLDAIWCAWDGPASEGSLVISSANRNVFMTGIDGGQQTFEYIKLGTPFATSLAQSFYEMTYLNAFYANETLAGKQVPRVIITPAYSVTQESLAKLDAIPDTYDRPGEAEKLGWRRAL